MKIRLKDIIDLDYFISMDDAMDTGDEIRFRAVKDRRIYIRCKNHCQTDKALLLSWLTHRRTEFFQEKDKKELPLLPGSIFSSLYTWMVFAMCFLGGISGISLVYSFLAYHGTHPINVAVFIALFVVLQVMLIIITMTLLLLRAAGGEKPSAWFHHSIIHTLLSAVFFNVLTRFLKKAGQTIFRKRLDPLEYTASLIRMKNREYKNLFFWPFFILIAVFAFCFSVGALGGTFFRVLVSDMAFGWQSTLMTSSAKIHDMVSFIALPWSWFMPIPLAHPSLDQIEGSRIILKDGISVLATQDLVSWWPFICMGILSYAVIPRGLLLLTGLLSQNKALRNFNFERPRFKQLIIRMQSPVLDIDAGDTPVNQDQMSQNPDRQTMKHNRINEIPPRPCFNPGPAGSGPKALILASKRVYTDAAIQKVIQGIKTHFFFDVSTVTDISFDFDQDKEMINDLFDLTADQVILLHEVWQPPIRGLLHYITQVKTVLPKDRSLWILLTRDPGLEDLCVTDNDTHFNVWKKAVFKLENPDIVVKRLVR